MLKQMETDIKSVSEQMTKLETRTTATEVRLGETEDRTTRLEKAVTLLLEQGATLAAKCESLEARTRRKNVRIHGITEGAENNEPR
uniref:Uncharacterized protein n=1 Tax=Knipowitschia caucasica TaxID=637954 RepID=A0AAV2MID2_KNICA